MSLPTFEQAKQISRDAEAERQEAEERIPKTLSDQEVEFDYCPSCNCGIGFKGYSEESVKSFIEQCESNSKYANGITGNTMSIPIWKIKELAGELLT